MAKLKTINLRGKEYTEVSERISYFRTAPEYQGWSMTSQILSFEDGQIIIQATIANKEQEVIAQGIAHEIYGSSNVNKTSFVENCETSAFGRALGNLGIGISGGSVATFEEVNRAVAAQEDSRLDLTDEIATRMEAAIKQGQGAKVSESLFRYKDSPNKTKILTLI